ncbi:class I SAM-dependent methyltransferase [Marivirga harenae]|uniref:class I SAM-dependent methyltransferase n=1 Tax=Marivirga harenae TaxID=2010992 RepID=UPI0026DF84B8|nr:class I SAM-dependent methyltransferase [Marivirga harenae]WKV13425.1 class I SAM-dependent methyltransferase [Marivirga harenae]
MQKLYIHTEDIHNTKAAELIVPLIDSIFSPESILDIGCGLGTWLKVFYEKRDITDILGLDGSYLDKSKLVIKDEFFQEADLRYKIDLDRDFDLVLCLEVAEHLPEEVSDTLIETLCRHSNNIVFSAAIPGQGGQNHINEQWPQYWADKFIKYGYKRYDLIRPKVWNNPKVDVWYRQNMFVFSKEVIQEEPHTVIAEIHPDLWDLKIKSLEKTLASENSFEDGSAGIKRSFRALKNAIYNKLK